MKHIRPLAGQDSWRQPCLAVGAAVPVLVVVVAQRLCGPDVSFWPLIEGLSVLAATWLAGEYLYKRPLRGARAALAVSEARSRALVEQTNDILLRVRSDRRRVGISPAIKSVLGYSVSEARGMSLRAVVHPDDLGRVTAVYDGLSVEAPRAVATFRVRHKEGFFIWTEAHYLRIVWADDVVETVIRLQNVTERYQEAEALRLATEAARAAQAHATETSQAKTDFLARMSHEIRTPLNAVIGFTSLLLDLPGLPPQGRHYSERIKGAGHALLTIVNDILDFAQVESGTVSLTPTAFDLRMLVSECLSIVQQAATAKDIALHVHIDDALPPAVLGDEARLRQILLNLLNNAVKFTDVGSVRLEIRHDEAGGSMERLVFSIIDTGIGIAAEDQADLFQRFRQVDGTIRRIYGGTGLGLAISKQLVELMEGTIGVTSAKGQGSTFWFALDLPPALLHAPAARPQRHKPKRALDLLVVEDVVINQELICLILKAGGHRVDIVGNGAEAIMAVEHGAYDAVLMDVQMPHMDGVTATRAIRDLACEQRAIPIIAMTANVLPEQTRQARDAGMIEIIHKPFTATEVYEVLDRVAGKPEAREACAEDAVVDRAVMLKLANLIGDGKVKALLGSMAHSLDARFDGDATTPAGRAALRRDAHSSLAGAGMLGFKLFSLRCQALETAGDDETFLAVLSAVRADAAAVVAKAKALSAEAGPLAEAA